MPNFKRDKLGRIDRPEEVTKFSPSRTIASHAKGLSVNEIMKRFRAGGVIPTRPVPGQFLDTTKVPDFFEALNQRVALGQYFDSLPSQVRFTFLNDPMNLVKFVNDPQNFQKALDMGILELNDVGKKRKAEFMASQAKVKADQRSAFVADVSEILKNSSAPPKV